TCRPGESAEAAAVGSATAATTTASAHRMWWLPFIGLPPMCGSLIRHGRPARIRENADLRVAAQPGGVRLPAVDHRAEAVRPRERLGLAKESTLLVDRAGSAREQRVKHAPVLRTSASRAWPVRPWGRSP